MKAIAKKKKAEKHKGDIPPSLAVFNISHEASQTAGKLKPLLENGLSPPVLGGSQWHSSFYKTHLGDTEMRDDTKG